MKYENLPDEDKLLMDELFREKDREKSERKIIRDLIASLRKLEMSKTTIIMNLSQKNIGEKFELGPNAAKPLTKRNRENIKNRISLKEVKINKHDTPARQQRIMDRINETKACSENGQKPESHNRSTSKNSWCYG